MMKIIIITIDYLIIITIIIVLFLVMEHQWNDIDGQRPKYTGKTCPSDILPTTNPT
jgi:hypothetical protein